MPRVSTTLDAVQSLHHPSTTVDAVGVRLHEGSTLPSRASAGRVRQVDGQGKESPVAAQYFKVPLFPWQHGALLLSAE